jgi:hypothetical protein
METTYYVSRLKEKLNALNEKINLFEEPWPLKQISQSFMNSSQSLINLIQSFINSNSIEYLKLREILNLLESILDFIFENLLIKTITYTKMDYDNFTCNFERIPYSDSKETKSRLVKIKLEAILENLVKPER